MFVKPKNLLFWHKLVILLAVPIILLTLGIAAAVWYALSHSAVEMERDSKQVLSDQVEVFLEKFIGERADRLDAQLRKSGSMVSFGANLLEDKLYTLNKSDVDRLLSVLYSRTSYSSNVFIVTKSRSIHVYPAIETDNFTAKQKDAFISSSLSKIDLPGFQANEITWSNVQLNPLFITPDRVVNAVAPVQVNGKTEGVIGISISLTKIISEFNRKQPIRGGYTFLLDTNSNLIGAPPHGRIELAFGIDHKEESNAIHKSKDHELSEILHRMVLGETNIKKAMIGNELKYLAYNPLTSVNWRMGLVVPVRVTTAASGQLVNVVNSGTRRVYQGILFWAAILLIVVTIAGFALARPLTQHIRKMSTVAEKLSLGNFEDRIPIITNDEIGTLGSAINVMADKIQSMIVDLNHVNRELKLKNQELQKEIEEKQATAESLKESEERYRFLVETMNEGIAVQEDMVLTYANQSLGRMLEYSPEELIGTHLKSLFNEKNLVIFKEQMELRRNGITFPYEIEFTTKSGKQLKTRISPSLKQFDGKHYKSSSAIIMDITERKRAEKELQNLRNYLSSIINSMPSILIGVNSDDTISQWNKAAERSTGLTAEAAFGQALTDVFPRISSEMEKFRKQLPVTEIWHERKKARMHDEHVFYEEITIYPLEGNSKKNAVILIDDVTEKVQMEEMMIQNEKMLSVGGLAAGMAHEINNPLAGMLQTASVMSSRLEKNQQIPANQKVAKEIGISMESIETFMEKRGIYRMIELIMTSGYRVAEIVENMLSFARKSDSTISYHLLDEILDKTLELAATDYDFKEKFDFKKIKIIKEYGEEVPAVPCHLAKIQQVLLNIFSNGAQAMQSAGSSQPQFVIRTYLDTQREMSCIEIEDNGPGMDEQTGKRVFEPFFTTKKMGAGTGLGLSVSYFIITENHNGELAVESSPGVGTTFIVRLPVNQEVK